MNLKKISIDKILITSILVSAPIFIILLVVMFRHVITPSNVDIVNELPKAINSIIS